MHFLPSISVLASVYQGEEYLPGFFENLQAQTIFPETELVLVLNLPNAREKQLCRDFAAKHQKQVQVLQAPRLETLGASWNRAWRAARAPYLAPWNVDDRRAVDSLQRQAVALDGEPKAVLCYGDYLRVARYGEEQGELRQTPAYSPGHFQRAFAQGGAFWLLRAAVGEEAGYYDEQFRVAADMDYSLRLAALGLRMVRAEGLLGYFTDAAQGLSTRQGATESSVERTAVQLRYGVFDKVDPAQLHAASAFRLEALASGSSWLPLSNFVPDLDAYLTRRQPLWKLGRLRHAVRAALQRSGLLPLLHRWQARLFKREI